MNEDTKIQKQAIGVNQAKQKSIYNYVNKTADLATSMLHCVTCLKLDNRNLQYSY